MLHHRRQHGLDIVNDDMITPFEQRPGPGRCEKPLTGPRGETGMPLTTDLNQIKDVIDQKLRAVLGGTTLLQLLQIFWAKPLQRTIES